MTDYIHQPPGTEFRSISGHYTITEAGHMEHRGGTLLYELGVAVVDNSCCGAGGCRFIHVVGYVTSVGRRTDPDGLPVSDVEPVADPKDRKSIQAILEKQFPHSQVSFRET